MIVKGAYNILLLSPNLCAFGNENYILETDVLVGALLICVGEEMIIDIFFNVFLVLTI
jgi:hypothetical protein